MNDDEKAAALASQKYLSVYATLVRTEYRVYRMHRVMCKALERVDSGEIDRLIICAPPRHGKTITVAELFPAWYLGKHPERHVINITHGDRLAKRTGRRVRDIIAGNTHQAIFPNSKMGRRISSADQVAANYFELACEEGRTAGSYQSVTVAGGIAGFGGNLLVIDDPVEGPEKADSPAHSELIRERFDTVWKFRLERPQAIIIDMTRWRFDDLVGWQLALMESPKADQWRVLSLPAIAEVDGHDWRKKGEPLCPELKTLEELERIRDTASVDMAGGKRAWLALFQQQPSKPEGNIFKSKWWKYYAELPDPREFDAYVQYWDCKLTDSTEPGASYVVGQWWGRTARRIPKGDGSYIRHDYYLLKQCRKQTGFNGTKSMFRRMQERCLPTHQRLIEYAAAGPALIEDMEQEFSNVEKDTPKGSKEYRAESIADLPEDGMVYLPAEGSEYDADALSGEPYVEAWVERAAKFPVGEADEVDCLSGALRTLRHFATGVIMAAPRDDQSLVRDDRMGFGFGGDRDSGWP